MNQVPQDFQKFAKVLIGQFIRRPEDLNPIEQPEDGAPVIVQKLPESRYEPLHCWHNCAKHVQKYDGRIIFGWALFYDAGMYQAQHHAIWCSPDGCLLDITPDSNNSVSEIIFLPDGRVPYDFVLHRHPATCYYSPKGKAQWGLEGLIRPDGSLVIENFGFYVRREAPAS